MPETVQNVNAGQITYVRWVLVFLLFVLSAVAYLDRVNLSVAGAKLTEEFAIANVQLGFIFSAFLFGYALFQTPAGWLADRLGARRVLAGGILWWCIFTALIAAIPSGLANVLSYLILLRFLLGAGEAVMYPASNQFVARWIPADERGAANGVIFAGVGIGAGITPPLVTAVMLHYGWRYSFWMSALIGVVAASVWYFAARDTPRDHPAVSPQERSTIEHGIPTTVGEQARPDWFSILTSGNVWILSFAYFCFGYVAWIFFGWIYIYLARVRGLDLKASALYAALPFLAMAACSPLGGLVSDLLVRQFGARVGRCSMAVVGFALTAVFVVLGAAAQDTRVASFVLAGGAGSLYLSQSAFWAVSADLGGKSAGGLSGFMNMANQIGGMITVSLTPLLAAKFGWSAGFRVAAVVAALGAVAWLFVDPRATLSPSMRVAMTQPARTEQRGPA